MGEVFMAVIRTEGDEFTIRKALDEFQKVLVAAGGRTPDYTISVKTPGADIHIPFPTTELNATASAAKPGTDDAPREEADRGAAPRPGEPVDAEFVDPAVDGVVTTAPVAQDPDYEPIALLSEDRPVPTVDKASNTSWHRKLAPKPTKRDAILRAINEEPRSRYETYDLLVERGLTTSTSKYTVVGSLMKDGLVEEIEGDGASYLRLTAAGHRRLDECAALERSPSAGLVLAALGKGPMNEAELKADTGMTDTKLLRSTIGDLRCRGKIYPDKDGRYQLQLKEDQANG